MKNSVLVTGLAVIVFGVIFFAPISPNNSFTSSSSTALTKYNSLVSGDLEPPDEELRKLRLADPATGEIPANIREKEIAFVQRLESKQKGNLQRALTPFHNMGPSNFGGRTRAAIIDINDSSGNTLLAGGAGGGLFKSTNGGQSWTKKTSSTLRRGVSSITQDERPGHRHKIYFSTGEIRSSNPSRENSAIYKSVDGGESFLPLSDFPGLGLVWRLMFDERKGYLFAATTTGLHLSKNGGGTWEEVLDINNINDVVHSGRNNDYYYAASSKKIYRSWDGINWNPMSSPLDNDTRHTRIVLAASPRDYGLVVLASGDGTNNTGLRLLKYRRGNGFIDYSDVINEDINFQAYNGWCMALAVGPYRSDIVYFAGVRMYEFNMTTIETRRVGSGYIQRDDSSGNVLHPDIHTITFFPGYRSRALVTTDGGVYKTVNLTDDQPVWTPVNDGFVTAQFYYLCMDMDVPFGPIAGGLQDNGSFAHRNSTVPAGRWTYIGGGDGSRCSINSLNDRFYYSHQWGSYYHETDELPEEYIYGSIAMKTSDDVRVSTALFMDDRDQRDMYFAKSRDIYRNRNAVANPENGWQKWTNIPELDYTVRNIEPAKWGKLYFSTLFDAYRVNTYPANPSLQDFRNVTPPGDRRRVIGGVTSNVVNSAHIMLNYTNYNTESIYYSTNAGYSGWTNVEGNLSGNNAPAILDTAILNCGGGWYDNIYLAGTTAGLFSTAALSGENTVWNREGVNTIGFAFVEDVETRDIDKQVCIATHGDGVFCTSQFEGMCDNKSGTALAVEWSDFRATPSGDRELELTWSTVNETNNAGFTVETSQNNAIFEEHGFVEGLGNSDTGKEYNFTISELSPGITYVRVKQSDYDGTISYSETIETEIGIPGGFYMAESYPNPAQGIANVELSIKDAQDLKIELYDMNGRRVLEVFEGQVQAGSKELLKIDAGNLSVGQYLLRAVGENKTATRSITVLR